MEMKFLAIYFFLALSVTLSVTVQGALADGSDAKYEEKKETILKEYPEAAQAIDYAERDCEDMFKEIAKRKVVVTTFSMGTCNELGINQALEDVLIAKKIPRHERMKRFCKIIPENPKCGNS
uniref:Saposin B-type domain-containing protein n=1 Tax=Trichuris muris TaxID=70415 RepID=A0A5S6QMJ7_TRIMR